jgi:hypothetical protein
MSITLIPVKGKQDVLAVVPGLIRDAMSHPFTEEPKKFIETAADRREVDLESLRLVANGNVRCFGLTRSMRVTIMLEYHTWTPVPHFALSVMASHYGVHVHVIDLVAEYLADLVLGECWKYSYPEVGFSDLFRYCVKEAPLA